MRAQEVFHLLVRAKEENRLHHAYAFTGPESPKKWEVLLDFLLRFSEKKISPALLQEGQHPDLYSIAPVEGTLSVEQIRALPKVLAYPPMDLWKRFVVFPEAALLNVQSANALLKILEEPPGHTVFFLFVRDMTELLPTIQSRVQQIRFSPLANEEILEPALAKELGLPNLYYAYAEGSFQKAKAMLDRPETLDFLDSSAEQLICLWESSPRVGSEQVKWLEGIDQEVDMDLAVEAWLLTLRDLSFVILGADSEKIHLPKYYDRLQALKNRGNESLLKEISEKTTKVSRYRVYREFHGNLKVDALALFVDLQLSSLSKL
jgi:DNA polymerase-3 subunit delta'